MSVSSNSSAITISLSDRYRYYADLLKLYREGAAVVDVPGLEQEFADIDACARQYCGRPLDDLTAVEIGFGPRPYRLMYLNARGINVFGIDMDQPLLTGSVDELFRILRRNGALRAVKSCMRYWLFERAEKGVFFDHLARLKADFMPDQGRLIVGNAGSSSTWKVIDPPDVIYSFRVLEHIDPQSLRTLVELMHRRISGNGVCYIVVTVFTGITGGHLPEWYSSRLYSTQKRSEPWEHLRGKRVSADTYLNRLTRRDYANLFSTHFDVLKDEPLVPDLGREFLSADVRKELSGFDDYELFSNDVLFILRPRDI